MLKKILRTKKLAAKYVFKKLITVRTKSRAKCLLQSVAAKLFTVKRSRANL